MSLLTPEQFVLENILKNQDLLEALLGDVGACIYAKQETIQHIIAIFQVNMLGRNIMVIDLAKAPAYADVLKTLDIMKDHFSISYRSIDIEDQLCIAPIRHLAHNE